VLTNLPRDAKATDPAVVAEVPRGKGRIVVWTMSASLYDDWLKEYENRRTKPPRAYYAKTANHDKIHRALSMVLTNLGVRMRQPRFAVFAGNAAADRFSPYLENLSDYDINAFHNW
jgi:hypothetical protein